MINITKVLLLFSSVALLQRDVVAVNVGDEDSANDVTGRFYVFADKAIHVVNPLDLSVDTTITEDQDGNPLTSNATGNSNVSRIWNDAIFVQNKTSGAQYIFVGEGDVYTDSSTNTSYSYVSVIDPTQQKIIGRTKVGARPVHIYGINSTVKAWSHSDAEGVFYVLGYDSSGNLTNKKVPAFTNVGGHGKLVVNDRLYPIGYGTNVAEQVIQKFDISNETRIAAFPYNSSLSNSSSCSGTHSAYYSRVNRHVYFECTGGSGILEWNTANDRLVAQHNISGTVFGTPGDDRIFATSSANSSSAIIIPGENGKASKLDRYIRVASQPGDPVFYSNSSSDTPGPFEEYTAFFPTARNTNKNNIKAAGDANVTSASYAAKPSDCRYSDTTVSTASVGSSSSGLQLATGPNNNVLTPQCGACADGINSSDPTQFNASLAGFRVFSLDESMTPRLISAGAVAPQASKTATANQCSFASSYRAAKRGGPYIATVADLPQPSIYIVDASSEGLYGRGFVGTSPKPMKIAWVPASTRSNSG